MTVRVQHDCYVVPGIGDLAVAIVRRRYYRWKPASSPSCAWC